MSDAKHTPGPWHVYRATDDTVYVESRDRSLARIHVLAGMPPVIHPVAMANARLIAAAPQMLEALERCRKLLEDMRSDTQAYLDCVDAIILATRGAEALATSRGESGGEKTNG